MGSGKNSFKTTFNTFHKKTEGVRVYVPVVPTDCFMKLCGISKALMKPCKISKHAQRHKIKSLLVIFFLPTSVTNFLNSNSSFVYGVPDISAYMSCADKQGHSLFPFLCF